MTGKNVRLFALLVLVVAIATACGSSPTTPTTTPPATTINEPPWTGTLTPNGGQTFSFTATAAGQVSATIYSLDPNPDLSVHLGLGLGLWDGQACEQIIHNDNAFQTSVLYGTVTAAGSLCARVYDANGQLTGPVDFDVRVVHP